MHSTIKSSVLKILNVIYDTTAYLPSIGNFQPLKGTFSALNALKSQYFDGNIITNQQEAGQNPVGSITEKTGFDQHNHQPWPVFWVRSDNARLIGKMLDWRDPSNCLCSEGVYGSPQVHRFKEDKLFTQFFPDPPYSLPGAWTSIVSNWGNGSNYFHWLCDSLTRLLIREQLPERTRILIPTDSRPFVKETMELLGLSDLCLEAPSNNLAPERFYFCSPTAMTGVWNPLGFDWLRKQFGRYRNSTQRERPIFITRRKAKRIPDNIAEIETLFIEHGFDIIDCADHSVREQIYIISSARAIAGLHGAAMTNLLWATPATPVLELFDPKYLNACFEQISFQGELKYSAIIMNRNSIKSEIVSWIRKSNIFCNYSGL